ncbi:MAG: hypothetical protein HFE63_05145 [Clostridiales bacterium]|nr:hypothetical protein [Clostridiales bacterium]
MKKTRSLSILLAILMLSSTVCGTVSCGSEDNPNPTDSTPPQSTDSISVESVETDRSQIKDELPVKDYNGEDFTILYRDEWSYEFLAEEQNGDIINDAIYARNSVVAERFNININLIGLPGTYNSNTFMTAVNNSVAAGDSDYDLITGYQANMITPAMEGYFMNIYDIPYINTEAPWWSEMCNDSLTVNGKLYMTTGDIALTLWDNMYVFYFNKKLADEYQIPNIYDIVNDGKWTLDKLYELSSTVSSDLNGNTIYDENDLYGFLTSPQNHMRAYMVSCETPITKLNSQGLMEACLNTERTQTMLDKLLRIHWTDSCWMKNAALDQPNSTQEPVIFTSDRALFMSGYLGTASNMRDMNTDFGIIPYPMLDENQDGYRTTSHNSVSMMCFPVTVSDSEMSGIITEALCAESYRNVIPKYYDIALKAKGARDDESAEMIDLIRDGLTFDFGWVHSVPMDSIGIIIQDLINNNSTNFASAWATKEAAVNNGLKKINEAYVNNVN